MQASLLVAVLTAQHPLSLFSDVTRFIMGLLYPLCVHNLIETYIIISKMDSPANNRLASDHSCKIYFASNVFGKPTRNREEDPSMFELLAWGNDGFQKHSFKKDEKFMEPTEAYLNMIGKNPWRSQTHQNYINYHEHCIEANSDVLHKIQNYIEDRVPQSSRIQKKSPNLMKKGTKKEVIKEGEKKQNNLEPNQPKSTKFLANKPVDNEINKRQLKRNSIADKMRSPKPKHTDIQKTHNKTFEGKTNTNKGYQAKQRDEQPELTANDQSKLIQQFKQTTRWIPNSAFTTYFGKPPFQNYGRGNTHPIDGGLVYGTYLYSHNVHPHRGTNDPKNMQSYPVALMKAKSQGTLKPTHPRTKPDLSNTDIIQSNQGQVEFRSKIQPQINSFSGNLNIQVPNLRQIQKFGGKKKSRVHTQNHS